VPHDPIPSSISSSSSSLQFYLGLHEARRGAELVGPAAEVHPQLEDQVAQGLAVGGLGALGGEAAEHVPVALGELGDYRVLHVRRAGRSTEQEKNREERNTRS